MVAVSTGFAGPRSPETFPIAGYLSNMAIEHLSDEQVRTWTREQKRSMVVGECVASKVIVSGLLLIGSAGLEVT